MQSQQSLNLIGRLLSFVKFIPAVKKESLGLGRIVNRGHCRIQLGTFLSMIETVARAYTAPLPRHIHTTWAC